MNTGHVYYSDWFKVDCVYENLITDFNGGTDYSPLTVLGTAIISAVNASGNAYLYSDTISIDNAVTYQVIFFLTKISGQLPTVLIFTSTGGISSNIVTAVEGLNVITLTATGTYTDAILTFNNTAAANWSTSEILIIKEY